jgi:radical SAM protein (TIGR04043 family)
MADKAPTRSGVSPALGRLFAELQSEGARVEGEVGGRTGGAGPSDAGMVLVEGVPLTFPFLSHYATTSRFVLRQEDHAWGLYRQEARVATVTVPARPRFYDLATEEGIPYWKIALLHLDSLASTVVQTCAYWGTDDQCRFCGIQVSLETGQTIAVKKPEQLAQAAVAARDLDGAVDVTLTTGTTGSADKGAGYIAGCAAAVKQASGLPVQAQFEPPPDVEVLAEVADRGVDAVGMHVESFDPRVLARVAPAKARAGIDHYFRAWRRAVDLFGPGQVSTYVILGMGEDPELTARRCREAIDLGVYPFLVPLRPVPGSRMADWLPPAPDYVDAMYRRVVPHLAQRGLFSADVTAGCARCQACSSMSAYEDLADGHDRIDLPVFSS